MAPLNNAVGVAINGKVTATFGATMDSTTINIASFRLVGPSGASISGTVAYVAASRTATFTPDSNLAVVSRCTATVTTAVKDFAGYAMADTFAWAFTTGAAVDSTAPRVISTTRVQGETGVPINVKVGASFSEAMDPSTLTSATFKISRGGIAESGSVTYSGVNAVFSPDTFLASNTLYSCTITTGARDLAGNALAADSTWSWTTGGSSDTISPRVTLVSPAADSTGVSLNKTISATFSEAMDPSSITNVTFKLKTAIGDSNISGTTAYDQISSNPIATFSPSSNLASNTRYTATVTTSVKDLAGNSLTFDSVWSFTTGTETSVSGLALGAAAAFGSFGGAAGITNEGLLTVINGDIGTTGASTTMVGFHDSVGDVYSTTGADNGTVSGRIYTNGPPPGGAAVGGNASTMAIATQALADANTAWVNLSPAKMPGGIDPGAGQLGGLVLAPGIYKAAGGSFLITGSDLTLDAAGDPNAIFVFQTATTLTVGAPGLPRSVILVRGAQAKNVYWQVGSSATINGSGGGTMVGTIISSAATTFSTSGNVAVVTLNGRALALNAGSTMVNTVISVPAL